MEPDSTNRRMGAWLDSRAGIPQVGVRVSAASVVLPTDRALLPPAPRRRAIAMNMPTGPQMRPHASAALLLALLVAEVPLAACAAREPNVGPSGPPDDCSLRFAQTTRPYGATDLENHTTRRLSNQSFTPGQLSSMFAQASLVIKTFTGKPFDSATMVLEPEGETSWRFYVIGFFADGRWPDEFFLTVHPRSQDVVLEPSEVRYQAVPLQDVQHAWDAVNSTHPKGAPAHDHLVGSAWNPAWPTCIRLEFATQGTTPGGRAYVETASWRVLGVYTDGSRAAGT